MSKQLRKALTEELHRRHGYKVMETKIKPVHIANALDHAYSEGKPDGFKDYVDLEYIISLGLPARMEAWQRVGLVAFQRTREAAVQ